MRQEAEKAAMDNLRKIRHRQITLADSFFEHISIASDLKNIVQRVLPGHGLGGYVERLETWRWNSDREAFPVYGLFLYAYTPPKAGTGIFGSRKRAKHLPRPDDWGAHLEREAERELCHQVGLGVEDIVESRLYIFAGLQGEAVPGDDWKHGVFHQYAIGYISSSAHSQENFAHSVTEHRFTNDARLALSAAGNTSDMNSQHFIQSARDHTRSILGAVVEHIGASRPAGRTRPETAPDPGQRILGDDAATEASRSAASILRAAELLDELFDQDRVGERRMRDRLLAQVQKRLVQFVADQNQATVVGPEAVAEVTALLEAVDDPTADFEVARAAGWLYWYRFTVLGPEDGERDLAAAMPLLVPVYQARPDAVPDWIRANLERISGSPEETANLAAVLVQGASQTGDRVALDTAINLLRQALAASPPDRARTLSNLGAALQFRFRQVGNLADLDAAVDATRAAVNATEPDDPARAGRLSGLGAALHARFGQVGNRADLDAAVKAAQAAVHAIRVGDADLAMYLSNLGLALHTRFEEDGDPADLDAAVDAGRGAVAATPPGVDRAQRLSSLGIALHTRFARAGDLADLDAAVDAGRAAVDAAPDGHPARAGMLSNLGAALGSRFAWAGDLADLGAAVDAGRAAVDAAPEGHPDRAGMLSNLGGVLIVRFEQVGDLEDLNEAIVTHRAAVDATPDGHRARAIRLSSLGVALRIQFKRSGKRADLDAAVTASQAAVDAAPDGHPARAATLSNLATARKIRFEETGNLGDLDAAIAFGRAAVDATPDGDPYRAGMLSNLGVALHIRFMRTGNPDDLDAAVTASRAAVDATPDGHPDRAGMLSNLGAVLQTRFERTGDLDDLDKAVAAGRDAVRITEVDHRERTFLVPHLASALLARHRRLGALDDLNEAITLWRQAIQAMPPDAPRRHASLANLANALATRSGWVGTLADLDEAINLHRQAASDDGPERAGDLTNLSVDLKNRYERIGTLADLDEAITVGREAVRITPAGRPGRADRLLNLGGALQARYRRLGTLADLDEAITVDREAVRITPAGRPERAAYLSGLCVVMATRARLGSLADFDEAISLGRQAVDATPNDHPDRAMYLSSLNVVLMDRSERLDASTDLDEAIRIGREAVAATAADHASLATCLYNLGLGLHDRYIRRRMPADLDEGLAVLGRAVAIVTAPASRRANDAQVAGRLAAAGERWSAAVDVYGQAVGLLGRVAPRSLTRGDQEHLIGELGGLASEAAACCVHAGQPGRAVELFEHGRGVLLGQALDTRTDLTSLTKRHPDLAKRFTDLRDKLDRPGDDAGRPVTTPAGTGRPRADADDRAHLARLAMERRREDAAEFDEVISEIRALPGFHRFLRPPPVGKLAEAASGGPVVVVNVSRFGSHALALTRGGVGEPVMLPGLTPEAVRERVAAFLTALAASGSGAGAWAEHQLADTLAWLWKVVAGPVLDRLGFTGPPGDGEPWPRLWWCTSGLLSFLPIHAAGRHDTRFDAAPATVMDRVVSSYTPTIRALAHARDARPATEGDTGGAGNRVVVAMPRTPHASDLPGAVAEAALLRELFPGQVSVLAGGSLPNHSIDPPPTAEATHQTVLRELPTAPWAHFACHGDSDLTNPSASRLLLTDHEERPLTVVDVARLRLDGAELAFLSACSTAQPGARLTDEAIHLASAFQLAGYRHVIATLWPIRDDLAVGVADDVYRKITATGDVAGAVHAATRQLRGRWLRTPSVWASHIHVGA